MLRRFFHRLGVQRLSTRELIVPGMLTIGVVCLLRVSSLLQAQEWMALDTFSRYCPAQTHPARITLVTVNEQDYQATGFPISADVLAKALTHLDTYRPRVIGLDIFRDLPEGQGQTMLRKILATQPNVIAAEVALSDEPMMLVNAPKGAPAKQVGFADIVVDSDGKIRRIVLSAEDEQGVQKSSFPWLLAKHYLAAESVELEAEASKLPQFYPNSGGYSWADAGAANNSTQMLMNFCMLQQPYDTVPLRDVLRTASAGDGEANKLRNRIAPLLEDRVVIIGKTATHAKDSFITSAASQTLYSEQFPEHLHPTKIINGVEIHSHATVQIIGTALGMKCILETWTELSEYLWIIAWGILGMTTSVLLRSPWKSVVTLLFSILLLTLLSYHLLVAHNIWAPIVPSALALCSAGLITAFFDRDMRFELTQRQTTIEQTYESVHSGPLQRLADIARGIKAQPPLSNEQLQRQLAILNTDMRNIFARMRQDAITKQYSLYLDDMTLLDLKEPLGDLLYQVYEHSIQQPLPGFKDIQIYVVPEFEKLSETFKEKRFNIAAKRGLCLFLQEALLNVGNHAAGATRLEVNCLIETHTYRLQIIDDGTGITQQSTDGQGTYQAITIAQRLGGQFCRSTYPLSNHNNAHEGIKERRKSQKSTICEIVWPRQTARLFRRRTIN